MQIHPEIYFSRLSHVQLIAQKIVNGFIIGKHKSPFHGYAVEFAEHKQYHPGDPIRHIDWKLLGKTEKLYTKKYEQETNMNCHVFIDNSSSMTFSNNDSGFSKLDYAIISSACFFYVLKKQVDAAALTIFNTQIEYRLPLKSNPQHYKQLYARLESLIEHRSQGVMTNFNILLENMISTSGKRGMVVLFSDFLFGDEVFENFKNTLKHLTHLGHEVLLFQLIDSPKELDFEFENRPIQFVDIESGESVVSNPIEIKETYIKAKTAQNERLKSTCISFGIELNMVNIHQSFNQILIPFFAKRK